MGKLLRLGNVMDNYDLSNLPLLGHCEDAGGYHPWLTGEQNRRANFSRRSVTVTTSEQVEREQLPSTGDDQIPEERALADFDISLASDLLDPLIVDEPVVGEPEDPFASLAAYQPLTFEDDSRHSLDSELGFFEGFTAEDLTYVVLTEPEGNDVLEQPEQSQGESDTQGIIIPESTIADTVSDKHSGKRRAPEPENVLIGVPESAIKESQRRSKRLTKKRQKLDNTDTELLSLSRGTATRSQFSTTPKKSATSQKNTEQNADESLTEWVKKETAKWVIRLKRRIERRCVCGYPNCGETFRSFGNLRVHIFKHIGISIYKCTYSECGDNRYFPDSDKLQRHIQSQHTNEKPYHCTLCGIRLGRLDNYQRHMRQIHKISL